MNKTSLKTIAVASTLACATLLSLGWSEQGGVSLSVESAQARLGRPLTPVSVAGVARRHYRRAAYGYGAGLAGAAVAGTAAAVAASSPYWGWGGNSNYADHHYSAGDHYYGGGAWGARAYVAPLSVGTENAPAWSLYEAYHAGGPWYGYNGWDDYKARNGIGCDPGSIVSAADGLHYVCQ